MFAERQGVDAATNKQLMATHGQALLFDRELSGNRDIACSTCHVAKMPKKTCSQRATACWSCLKHFRCDAVRDRGAARRSRSRPRGARRRTSGPSPTSRARDPARPRGGPRGRAPRTPASAMRPTDAAMVRLTLWAPEEPPVTIRAGRSGSRPTMCSGDTKRWSTGCRRPSPGAWRSVPEGGRSPVGSPPRGSSTGSASRSAAAAPAATASAERHQSPRRAGSKASTKASGSNTRRSSSFSPRPM